VHHEIGEIDQDPVAEIVSLHVARMHALLREALDDGVADRLRLPPLRAADDHEGVGERRDPLQGERHGVLRLPIGGRLERERDFLLK
jgi:hypothetical protein